MEDIIKKLNHLKNDRNNRINEAIKIEAKEQKCGFRRNILGTLSASLLENALTGRGVIRAGEGTIRAGQNF